MRYDQETARLSVFNIESSDAGRYTCRAINDLGQIETTGQLIVKDGDKVQKSKEKPSKKKEKTIDIDDGKPPGPPDFLLKLKDETVKLGEMICLVVTSKFDAGVT